MALIYIKTAQSLMPVQLDKAEVEIRKALEINIGDPQATNILETIQDVRNACTRLKGLQEAKEE